MHELISMQQMMLASASNGFRDAVLADSPWGFWRQNEAPPSITCADSSGNGRVGTYAGANTASPPIFLGNTGSVLYETSGYVSIGTNYTVPVAPNPLTLMCAIKTTVTSATEQNILSNDNSAGTRLWQFRMSVTGKAEFVFILPSVVVVTGSVAINDGNPHLLHAVFDPTLSAGSGILKLYVDGVLDTQSSTIIVMAPGSTAPAICARNSGGTVPRGLLNLSESAIFQSALSSARVAAHWSARNT